MNGDSVGEKKEGRIRSEVEIEGLLTISRKVNDEVRSLKGMRSMEATMLLFLSDDIDAKKNLEKAELSELAAHSTERMSRDKADRKGKKFKLEEEVLQLHNDLIEAEKRASSSFSFSSLSVLEKLLNNIALSLETKIGKSEESNLLALKLFEKLLRLTNERERAMRSMGIRERLRARITDLKRREAEEREATLSSGSPSDLSLNAEFLQVRNKCLTELDALKEANSHLAYLLRNTKLSRDGDCDRESALPREVAFQSFACPDTMCEELRQRIAEASKKRQLLQLKLDKLKKEEKIVDAERYDGVRGRENILTRELELAKIHLKDVSRVS